MWDFAATGVKSFFVFSFCHLERNEMESKDPLCANSSADKVAILFAM